jgi:hypothetical protein
MQDQNQLIKKDFNNQLYIITPRTLRTEACPRHVEIVVISSILLVFFQMFQIKNVFLYFLINISLKSPSYQPGISSFVLAMREGIFKSSK